MWCGDIFTFSGRPSILPDGHKKSNSQGRYLPTLLTFYTTLHHAAFLCVKLVPYQNFQKSKSSWLKKKALQEFVLYKKKYTGLQQNINLIFSFLDLFLFD